MDTQSDIDTVKLGYEETAKPSKQPQASHTSMQQSKASLAVQDALSVAAMLQQLRTQRLDNDLMPEGV